jgi:hypothetical protein
VALETADAGAEVAVHHLDDRPEADETAIDLERAHVVGEADIGAERSQCGHGRLDAHVLHAERIGQTGGAAARAALIENPHLMAALLKRRQHRAQIAVNAAGGMQRVLCDDDFHGCLRRTATPSSDQASPLTPSSRSAVRF